MRMPERKHILESVGEGVDELHQLQEERQQKIAHEQEITDTRFLFWSNLLLVRILKKIED
eukprot:Skav224860  [mRNA]  locus=scaffold322:236148:236327:+ [translate_table: standard]